MAEYQRWSLVLLHQIRHGKGLAGASHAEQGLALIASLQPTHQLPDCSRLVAHRLEIGLQFKFAHVSIVSM